MQFRHIPKPLETLTEFFLFLSWSIHKNADHCHNEDSQKAPPGFRDTFCTTWDHLMKTAMLECGAHFHSSTTHKSCLPTFLSLNVLWLLFLFPPSNNQCWWVNRNWVFYFRVGNLLNVSHFSKNHQKWLAFAHNSIILHTVY